ncbi:MAG TPA: hypothetical protein VJ922_02315 [Actinomycetota bacterium]|nr:hypothetical protein [Actinomycetota bacterium]
MRRIRGATLAVALTIGISAISTSASAGLVAGLGELASPAAACKRIDVPVATPFGLASSCPGVRPGALLESPIGFCTFNFLFKRGTETFAGTAGHCALDELKEDGVEKTTNFVKGGWVKDAQGKLVGNFAYAVLDSAKGLDFSLVRLNATGIAEANAQMCHFGGPTGIAAPGGLGSTFRQFGNGLVIGELVPGRTYLGFGSDATSAYLLGLTAPGDSGSGVIDAQGRAVGALVAIGLLAGPGQTIVSRLDVHLARAITKLGGVPITILTAPLL